MSKIIKSKGRPPQQPKARSTISEEVRNLNLKAYQLVKTNKKGKSVTKEIADQQISFVNIDEGEIDFDFSVKALKKSVSRTEKTSIEVQKVPSAASATDSGSETDLKVEIEKTKKSKVIKKDGSSVKLRLSWFEMSTTPITQGVWEYVMGFNPSYYRKRVTDESEPNKKVIRIEKDLNRPVENITWFDAIAFCNKLSELEGLQPYYNMTNIRYDDGKFKYRVLNAGEESPKKKSRHIVYAHVTRNVDAKGYHLPTVAQHEYISKLAWEKEKEQQKGLKKPKVAQSRFKSINLYPKPVASGKPNALGLYDLDSNIVEMLYDYDVHLTGSLKDEMAKLDRENPYNFLRGLSTNYFHSESLRASSIEDKEFLEALTVLENPVIEPKTQPGVDDFISHCVSGNTSYGSQLDKQGFYYERDGSKLAGKYTESQFSRSPAIGFRIVRFVRTP